MRRNFLKYFILILCMAMSITFSIGHAALMNIVIDAGQTGGIPIAVVPFNFEGGDKNEVLDLAKI
jgi:hypothetical protein